MKIRKNKGFSKPAILVITAAVLAGIGYGAYHYLNSGIKIEGANIDAIDDTTKELLQDVDLTSPESIAAALYTSVLTENFIGVPVLVERLRALEYTNDNPGKSISDMTDEDKTKPVDISPYLSGAAIDKLIEKVQYIDQRLSSKQYETSYKFYLSSLVSIFSFYHSQNEDLQELNKAITAYQAFSNNQDYTINDIRALFGPINALKVCRYLMGSNDYSRISPPEMQDYITEEISRLMRQIPVNLVKKQRVYSTADFANITISTLKDVITLNHSIPSLITNISLIEGVNKDQVIKSYEGIKKNYAQTVDNGLSFLTVAEVFYQCQATTSEPFKVNASVVGKPYMGVANIGKLKLNAFKIRLTNGLTGCAGINEVFVLVPDLNGYKDLLNRGVKKMSDLELATFNNDVKLISDFYSGHINALSLIGSDVAAVENHLEQNPEQGYFIGIKEQGLLYNLKLDSFAYLRSLDLSPNTEIIFAPTSKLEKKRTMARYKLALIEDFRSVEKRMADLDFTQLEDTPYQYTVSRIAEDNALTFNYQNLSAAIENINNHDSSVENFAEDPSDTENTIEIASSITIDDSQIEELSENNTISSTTVIEDPVPNAEASQKPVEVAQAEAPAKPIEIEKTENTAEVAEKPAEAVASNEEPKTKTPLTLAQLKKAKLAEVEAESLAGNSDAMYEMAVRYINGNNGARRNVKKGTKLLEQAVAANNLNAEYMLGSIYRNSSKNSAQKKKGVQYILHSAEEGLTEATGTAGAIYLEGKEAPQNYAKAKDLLSIASDNDDHKAQYLLASMYLQGIGVKKSPTKALALLTSSAKTNADAALELAKIYDGGVIEDVEANQNTADEYYTYAARHNIKEAYRRAGLTLIKKKSTEKEAIKYLTALNDKSDKEVSQALLDYYVKTNNKKEIVKFIANADASVQDKFPVEMGILYETGNGVKQDYNKAQEFYRKGISLNIPASYCRLGDLFYQGKGVKQDLRAAVGQYTRGSDAGEADCSKSLAFIKITQRNYENFYEAFTLISKTMTIDKNSNILKDLLGAMYIYGQGTEKDEATGIKVLEKSSSPASAFLKTLHSGNSTQMLKNACTNPVFAGAYGIKEKNNAYLAVASLGDPFFLGDLKNSGFSTSYDDIILSAVKICPNVKATIMYDPKPSFKKLPKESTPVAAEQYQLGMIYFAGTNGVQRDYYKAFAFMKKASEQGYAKAHNNLGVFHLLGIGTPKNGKAAFESFMRAAATGDSKANFNAAAVRKNGIDIKPDHSKAMDQLISAAGKGNATAGMHLIYSYDYGNGNKKSDYDAFKAFANMAIEKE